MFHGRIDENLCAADDERPKYFGTASPDADGTFVSAHDMISVLPVLRAAELTSEYMLCVCVSVCAQNDVIVITDSNRFFHV